MFRAKKNARFYLFDSSRSLDEALRVIFCLDYRACGSCTACELLASGVAQDVFYLRSEDGAKIKDASVEEAVRFTMTEPTLRYRVVVIYDAEKMTERAQNRLLKSLEQPNEHVLYLMATAYPYQLLSTVLSRAIRVHLPLGHAEEKNGQADRRSFATSEPSVSVSSEEEFPLEDAAYVATLLLSEKHAEKERFFEQYGKKENQVAFSELMCSVVLVLRERWHQQVLAGDSLSAKKYEKAMLSVDKMLRHIDQNGHVALNIDIVSGGNL